MNIEDAIDTLTDGDDLREMTRHNAADFVKAIAVLVEAARMWLNPNIEAGTKAYIEKWVEIAPHTDTRACFEAGLAAAFTPGDTDE